MKRILAIVLCLVLILGCVGCSGGETVEVTESDYTVGGDGGSGGTTTTDTNVIGGSGGSGGSGSSGSGSGSGSKDNRTFPDLKGAEIKIVATSADTFRTSKGSTPSSKAAYQAMQDIKKNLNCKVSISIQTQNAITTNMQKAQLAGEKFADVVAMPMFAATGPIIGGSAMDLNKIKTLDLKKDYMNVGNILDNTSVKGKNFSLISARSGFGTGKVVFFNKSILTELGYKQDHVYNLVNSGKWTISEMRAMAKKAVLDKDGKPGLSTKDRFGILVNDYVCDGAIAILAANNAQMLKNNKGTITYNMESKEVINAVQLARDIYTNDGVAYGTSSNDQEHWDLFKTGHGLFLVAPANAASVISDMDADYGLVPFPTQNGKNFRSFVTWNACTIFVPSGLSEKEQNNVGYFLQEYLYQESLIVEESYDEFAIRYLRDDQSKKNLKTMVESSEVRTDTFLCSPSNWSLHEGTFRILYNCVPNSEESITATIAKGKNGAVAGISDFLKKH